MLNMDQGQQKEQTCEVLQKEASRVMVDETARLIQGTGEKAQQLLHVFLSIRHKIIRTMIRHNILHDNDMRVRLHGATVHRTSCQPSIHYFTRSPFHFHQCLDRLHLFQAVLEGIDGGLSSNSGIKEAVDGEALEVRVGELSELLVRIIHIHDGEMLPNRFRSIIERRRYLSDGDRVWKVENKVEKVS